MGGKEGAWGYLAQAVVSVIYSLVEEDWETVQVEPDTTNDKVDIAWFYKDQSPRVVQVKTSKNNFTLPDIRRWLESLIDDVKDAQEYELILLGTCNDETKKVLNRVNERNTIDTDFGGMQHMKINKEKIKITLKTNEQDSLDSQIYRYLSKFLSKKGKHPNNSELEIMCKAIGYQYMVLSTNGKKESKDEFEKRLLSWIDSFLGISEAKRSALKIEFYLKDLVPFSSEMSAVRTKLINSKYINSKKNELISTYNKISETKIEKVKQIEPKKIKEPDFMRIAGLAYNATMTRYSEIGGKRCAEIESLAKRLLDVSLNDEFFYVGNLKEPTIGKPLLFGYSHVERTGTKEEKDKHELILDFENELEILNSYIEMFEFIDSINLIPLVIRNSGTLRDEEIKVKIYLSNGIDIVNTRDFLVPEDRVIKDFTGFKGILHRNLSHRSDGHINSYSHQMYNFHQIPIPGLDDGGERNRDLFKDYLSSLFDFELHSEQDGHLIVFKFDKLNPKEILAFPCLLPVRATNNFEIKYVITSANLPTEEKGTLIYKVEQE